MNPSGFYVDPVQPGQRCVERAERKDHTDIDRHQRYG